MLLRRFLKSLSGARPQSKTQSPGNEPHFVLVLMRSSIGRHFEVFREVIDVVAAGLAELGYTSVAMVNEFAPPASHIVKQFG